jgi:hypothetical protein
MNENAAHRPGAVSIFFIYKAGFFAACFWGWLATLALLREEVSAWHLIAVGGAICTTLVAVLLGVRHALQRNAAARHEQVMRALVELSWHSFAEAARDLAARESSTVEHEGVIRLAPDARRRPRR